MAIIDDADLAGWLTELAAVFQDRSRRPALDYSNLVSLESPTQIYAISIPSEHAHVGAVVVCHTSSKSHQLAQAVVVGDLIELAKFAETADERFGTTGLVHRDQADAMFGPPRELMQIASVSLAGVVRRRIARPVAERSFVVGARQLLRLVSGEGALWNVVYRKPLPEVSEVLAELGDTPQSSPTRAQEDPSAAPAIEGEAVEAYGAYSEPIIWFGEPLWPTMEEDILGQPWNPMFREKLVHRGKIDGLEVLAYDTGFFLVITRERDRSAFIINQVFSVLGRSGVLLCELPNSELVAVRGVNLETGTTQGSHATVTNRNRFLRLGIPTLLYREPSWVLPPDRIGEVFEVADVTARNAAQSREALRILSAYTLLARHHCTEAFVMGWTIIEANLRQECVALWEARGRSKRRTEELLGNWSASHQIDLLIATGNIDSQAGEQLHQLRKKRNRIVHELHYATEQEALDCVRLAHELSKLPSLSAPLTHRQVIL